MAARTFGARPFACLSLDDRHDIGGTTTFPGIAFLAVIAGAGSRGFSYRLERAGTCSNCLNNGAFLYTNAVANDFIVHVASTRMAGEVFRCASVT
jgi:hypothetical protein